MKRAEHISEVPLPQNFGVVVSESSLADLRMLESGTVFVDAHRSEEAELSLVIASTPLFLRATLEARRNQPDACWLMIVDAGVEQVAEMLEDTAGWTLDARAEESHILAFRIRPSNPTDRSLADVAYGLRLAMLLISTAHPAPTSTSVPKPSATTLLSLVKQRVPRRVKTLIKKGLARK